MSMVIAHNMSAINTKRQFSTSARGMSGSMERLSSGYKINTGKDDPSGLVISEQLRSQISGLKRAQQNTEEAINVMGIAEGALNEMNSILKKMKALAIHSANNGVTSPEQVAADQAEMDSSIQTLDRIAQTTKFSDQNLLNGSKEITFEQDTLTKGTQQNSLLNTRESTFNQIYKRDGYAVSINFTGTKNADSATGIGKVDFTQQAMKAYLEVDTAPGASPQPQVDSDGNFTQDQQFTLTGNKGSRTYKFKQGTSVADMVSQIKNNADSTGIDASLVFNSAQKIAKVDHAGVTSGIEHKVQISNLTGLGGRPLTLTISGTASGTNFKNNTISDVKLEVNMKVTKSGAASFEITAIGVGKDGKVSKETITISGTASGGFTPVAFQTGLLAGITVKSVNNVDFGTPSTGASGEAKVASSQIDGNHNSLSIGSVGGIGAAREPGGTASGVTTVAVFNNTITEDGTGYVLQGVTGVEFASGGAVNGTTSGNSVQFGLNTDGQGRIYIKFLDDNSFELYKDAAMTEESKVATGINGQEIKAVNNSGLEGIILHINGTDLASKRGVYLAFGGIEGQSLNDDGMSNGVHYNGNVVNTVGSGKTFSGTAMFDADRTFVTGVELGNNTSDEGRIYLKNVYDHETETVQVFAYKHKDMRDEDMVAFSQPYKLTASGSVKTTSGVTSGSAALTIVLNEVRNADNTHGTGLGIILSVTSGSFDGLTKSTTMTGDMTFMNLAARIYTQDYGSDSFLKITQDKGAIFHEYGSAGDVNSKRLVDAGSTGTTRELRGQDATLSVNGGQVYTQGLKLSMATQDIQANLTFNEGNVGSTTLAQVGYGTGSIFTKIGALNLSSVAANSDGLSGLLCNAGHQTTEKISNFNGGMQLQLGEGAGDQNRTVVSIKNLTADNVGRVTKGGYWDTGSPVWTEKTFTLKDVMGSGSASLSHDPVLAMSIIEQAISDVSETRALIGAMQSNLLQTNSNNLSVTMENIQKTESGIRDADMADEMTDFTKNQVLQNAAMSMMSQANQSSQSVLQLLQ